MNKSVPVGTVEVPPAGGVITSLGPTLITIDFVEMPVASNASLASLAAVSSRGMIDRAAERRSAESYVERLRIKTPSVSTEVGALSGGNQQKVALARWLSTGPEILILDEPTQGVDVGARAEIWQIVRRTVDAGAGALVVSSDYEELSRVCDRVLLLRDGRIAAELHGDSLTEENLDHLTWTAEVAA